MAENTEGTPPVVLPGPGGRLHQEQLDGADLREVDLSRTTLERVSLKGADLRGARLCGATLVDVDLTNAKLDGADLSGARLEKVALDDATMDDLDLRGAVLERCSLDRVRAQGLRAAGVELSKVSLAEIEIEGAVLDGATLSDVALRGAVLRGLSGIGLHAADGAWLKARLVDCDLAGASIEDAVLQDVEVQGCSMRAVALVGSKLKGVASVESSWNGAVVDGCRGIGNALERDLEGAGARLRHAPVVRLLRRIKASRGLQVALVLGLLALILGLVMLLRSPGAWPSAVLMSRFEALEGRNDIARCEPLIRVSSALSDRADVEPSVRLRSLRRAAECQHQLDDRPGSDASLQRYQQLAQSFPEQRHAALLSLGDLLLGWGRLEDASDLLATLRQGDDPPAAQLEQLRFEARLLEARGVAPVPRGPESERSADDPWRSLRLDMAEVLLNLPQLAPHHLEKTPSDLLVTGDWALAEELMAGVQPPLEPDERWELTRLACDRLRELGAPEIALALVSAHQEDGLLDDLADIERLGLLIDLHRELGSESQALEMLWEIEDPQDPRLALELRLLRASSTSALGDHREALALLEAVEIEANWPFDLLARLCWAIAEARLASGDEVEAVQALEPALVAVNDKEPAQNLLRELARFMERLDEPGRVSALLERVDNPMLSKAGQGQELALTVARARAREGSLTPDDPALLSVLERGTPDQVQEAAHLLLDSARGQGLVVEAVERLRPFAKALADPHSRENLGILLAETCVGERLTGCAIELLDEHGLEGASDQGVRSRALALRVGLAVDEGQLDQALARYRSATSDPEAIERWVVMNLGRRLLDALQSADRLEEALALSRELRAESPEEQGLWQESLTCAVALGGSVDLDRELAAAEAAIGPCASRIAVTRARLDLGVPATGLEELERACSSASSAAAQRLDAATALGQAGRPGAALDLVRSAAQLDLEPELEAQVMRELANWHAATGSRQEAVDVLEDAYLRSSDGELRRLLTDALLGQLGARGEPEPVLAAYQRFVDAHPERADEVLWRQAALSLIHTGHPEQVEALGGDPGWRELIARELERASYAAMVDEGDFDAAWAWLTEALERADGQDAWTELVHMASQLADRSDGHERLSRWLDQVEARVDSESPLRPLLQLKRARAFEVRGEPRAAIETIEPTLREVPADMQGEVWGLYARNLGRVNDASAIEASIQALQVGRDLPLETEARVRLVAAEELIGRQDPAEAAALLEPLAGRALEPALAEPIQDLLARSLSALGRYDQALAIPERFLGAGEPCAAWLAVVLHLPGEADASARARSEALHRCAPEDIPQHQVLTLGEAVGRSDPEGALAFLDRAREVEGLAGDLQRNIDIERARLLAELDRTGQAMELLEAVLDQAEQPRLAGRAAAAMMRLLISDGAEDAVARIQAVAERGLARVEGEPQVSRELVRETSQALRELEAFPEAITWQQRLVELHTEPDEGRGYALLQLIHLQLDAHPGDPSRAGRGWLEQLDEARALAAPGTHLHDEVNTLTLAWKVVQAGSEDRIVAMLRSETSGLDNDTNLLNSVAARLDTWRHAEGAAAVRKEREARLQP